MDGCKVTKVRNSYKFIREKKDNVNELSNLVYHMKNWGEGMLLHWGKTSQSCLSCFLKHEKVSQQLKRGIVIVDGHESFVIEQFQKN